MTSRDRAALSGQPGFCRALNPEGTFMCSLDAGHDGAHDGFELPTVTLDEPHHAFDPGYTGLSDRCNALVERDDCADDCGLPRVAHTERRGGLDA